jgi:hypothetical protein
MSTGNGTKPAKTAQEVTVNLRHTLEDKLGAEKADAILEDPTSLKAVVGGEGAADVAEIMLRAWNDLSSDSDAEAQEETEEAPQPKRRSKLGRVFRLLIVAGVIFAVVSILKGRGDSDEDF